MPDITELIFKSSTWLLAGLFLYYFLSCAKVFLLAKIQPQLFYSEAPLKITVRNLWKLFSASFFSDSTLHQSTGKYLLGRGGKKAWQLVGNKKIDLYYRFLDALSSMLKPFIIIAACWAVLKYLVLKKIAYDAIKITLGQIQPKIAYIESIPFINFIDDHKAWFFAGMLLVCALLGLYKKWPAFIKRTNEAFSAFFTILGILGSLTFFGPDLGALAKNSAEELRDLQLEIGTIHENICHEVAEIVVYEDLSEAIAEDLNNHEREKQRLHNFYDSMKLVIYRPGINNLLGQWIKELEDGYAENVTLRSEPKGPGNFKFTGHMDDFFKQDAAANPSATGSYWQNSKSWTKGAGLHYQELTKDLKVKTSRFEPVTDKQVHALAENILDILGKEIINKTTTILGIDNLELPKTIASFLSIEKCRECFVSKISNALQYLGRITSGISKINSSACFKKQGNSTERIEEARKENNNRLRENFNDAIHRQELANANDRINEVIDKKIADLTVGNQGEMIRSKYKQFIENTRNEYKNTIRLDEMNLKDLKKTAAAIKVDELILKAVLRSPGIVRYHPFPRLGCPLCAYSITRFAF